MIFQKEFLDLDKIRVFGVFDEEDKSANNFGLDKPDAVDIRLLLRAVHNGMMSFSLKAKNNFTDVIHKCFSNWGVTS